MKEYNSSEELHQIRQQLDEIVKRDLHISKQYSKIQRVCMVFELFSLIGVFFCISKITVPNVNYCNAISLYKEERYEDSLELMWVNDYKNSHRWSKYLSYVCAKNCLISKDYEKAIEYSGYFEDEEFIALRVIAMYQQANMKFADKDYREAGVIYSNIFSEIDNLRDKLIDINVLNDKLNRCNYQIGYEEYSQNHNWQEAISYFEKVPAISESLIQECYYNLGLDYYNVGDYQNAAESFAKTNFLDSELMGELSEAHLVDVDTRWEYIIEHCDNTTKVYLKSLYEEGILKTRLNEFKFDDGFIDVGVTGFANVHFSNDEDERITNEEIYSYPKLYLHFSTKNLYMTPLKRSSILPYFIYVYEMNGKIVVEDYTFDHEVGEWENNWISFEGVSGVTGDFIALVYDKNTGVRLFSQSVVLH